MIIRSQRQKLSGIVLILVLFSIGLYSNKTVAAQLDLKKRVVEFPASGMGRLYLNPSDSFFMQQWPEPDNGILARGRVSIPSASFAMLATGSADAHCLKLLDTLKPGSIQGLDVDGSIVTVEYLKKIEKQKSLRTLVLRGTDLEDKDLIGVMKHLPQLVEMDIGYTKITDKSLAALAKMPHLTTLRLRKTAITKAGLKYLSASRSLRYLDLADTAIADDSLSALTPLTRLSTLNLARTNITDAGICNLHHLKSLKCLDVSKSGLTDQGLQDLISHLPDLEQLNLSNTRVTSRGVIALSKLTHLRKLWLRGLVDVDDTVVAVLSTMSSLSDVEVQGTRLGVKSVELLGRALPYTEVHSKTPCSCHRRTRVN